MKYCNDLLNVNDNLIDINEKDKGENYGDIKLQNKIRIYKMTEAIRTSKPGKSSGQDSITSEMIKNIREVDKQMLMMILN